METCFLSHMCIANLSKSTAMATSIIEGAYIEVVLMWKQQLINCLVSQLHIVAQVLNAQLLLDSLAFRFAMSSMDSSIASTITEVCTPLNRDVDRFHATLLSNIKSTHCSDGARICKHECCGSIGVGWHVFRFLFQMNAIPGG